MNKKIKVLQLLDSLNVGGAEVLAVNIFNLLLKEENIESYLCATRNEGELKNGINNKKNYFFLKKKSTLDVKSIINLYKYIKINNINIIHAHTTSYFIISLIKLITFSKFKIIWHNHTGSYVFLKGYKLFILKILSNKINVIINVNKELISWSEKELYSKNIYLPNFPLFNNSKELTKLKGEEKKRIVIVGGIRKVKNHLSLLKAFNLVIKEHSDWSLHIVGKRYNDNCQKIIYEYVKENNLNEHVFFYDLCTDIKNILSQANIGVLSSDSEGLPIALLEYGLAKLPVIVTDVGECSQVVENNFSGLIVPPKNHKYLFHAISELINSEEKRFLFAKNLNKEIENNYSKESFISRTVKIYKELF